MAKYEIMLVVRGDVDEQLANKTCNDLSKELGVKNIDLTNHGLKELAYPIQKIDRGYYFQLNFESTNTNGINEFRRLTRINKNVLRHLIINLEKDYGYRATINEKKIKSNKKRAEIYARIQDEIKKRNEDRVNSSK